MSEFTCTLLTRQLALQYAEIIDSDGDDGGGKQISHYFMDTCEKAAAQKKPRRTRRERS